MKRHGWLVTNEPRLKDANDKVWIPDLIATKNGKAVLIDPTVVFEQNGHSLQRANTAKISKYSHLIDQIKIEFNVEEVAVHGLAIGARGGWTRQNTSLLESVGINDKGFMALLCRFALRGTINMLRLFTDPRSATGAGSKGPFQGQPQTL